jgi:putative flippase GtrA
MLFPLNLFIAWSLTEAGMDYRAATVAGFFTHVSIAFFINRTWTFHKAEVRTDTGLLKTWTIGASDLAIALAMTTALVEYAGLGFLYARIGAALTVFIWSYVLNCIFTFRVKVFS